MRNFSVIAIMAFLLISCNKDTNEIFDMAPHQRMEQTQADLKSILVSQTDGWEMIYFPSVERLYSDVDKNVVQSIPYSYLYTDLNPASNENEDPDRPSPPGTKSANRNYRKLEEGRKYLGRGGYYFLMKFLEDGKVEMVSDIDFKASKIKESEYSISQNSFVQLNFITPNYIFDIKQQVSFLFYKEQEDGSLVFTTNRYEDESREYIVLRPLKKNTDLSAKMDKAFSVKRKFESIISRKPKLTILDEYGNVLFESGRPKTDSYYSKVSRRYALFMKNTSPRPDTPPYNTHYAGLGSGYVALDGMIYFAPGIRWNDEIIFQDFREENGKFVSKVKGYTAIIQ